MANVMQSDLFRDVLERAISSVAEQDVGGPRAAHEEVLAAVVVIVDECGRGADAVAEGDAGLFGDVLERPVALVAVQDIGTELVDEIDVVVPVAVVVADGNPAAVIVEVDLEGLALLAGQEAHSPRQAGLLGDVPEVLRFLSGSLSGPQQP